MTVVSAWATESGLALGQVSTTDGEGEISAIPRLLSLLDVSGCIVTMDAAGCQSDIAEQITEGGGDYVLTVKGNQGGLREDCERWLFEATLAGAAALFMLFDPVRARREVVVREQRTAVDFAHVVRDLLTGPYAAYERVVLVMDNLNTHTTASLYKAFPAAEARALAERLEIHYTPTPPRWGGSTGRG